MSKFVYPAIFSWSSEDCTYYVTFPDIESCFTDGDSIAEAMENASDALNLMLYYMEKTGEALPEPTPLEKVPVPANGFVNLVMADTAAYQEVIERENNPINYARKKAGMNIKQLAARIVLSRNGMQVAGCHQSGCKTSLWTRYRLLYKF